jgi:hypothetical protein
MAEKVQKLGLERDYKQYLYFIDKEGDLARAPRKGKSGDSPESEHANQ